MKDSGSAGEQVLQGIRRQLEWQVESGRRYVIDEQLAKALTEPPAPRPALTAAPGSSTPSPASVSTGSSPGESTGSSPAGSASTAPAVTAASTIDRRTLDAPTRCARLAELESKALECTRCPLHDSRKRVVFGTGNPDADLMFIGEAPGRDEDEQGEPFVGRAGQLLTRIIEAIELQRSDVYIANVLKCRPPENRNPNSAEIALCSPFLYEQIEWVAPKVICALGRFACMTLLKSASALGAMRGRVHEFQGTPVVVTYHPAALLRYPKLKRPTWEDVKAVQKILAGQMPGNWAK